MSKRSINAAHYFLTSARCFSIQELFHKANQNLPTQHVQIIQSYLAERTFYVHYGESDSSTKPIPARVLQGSVLGPLLYFLYTADIPEQEDTLIATIAHGIELRSLMTTPLPLRNFKKRLTQ